MGARSAQSNEGQATLEYVLLLLIVGSSILLLTRTIIPQFDNSLFSLGARIEKNLKTGRASVQIWKN